MTLLLADLRKALISPNEDFVVMVPLTNQDKTRVIGQDDLNQIKKEAEHVYFKKETLKEPDLEDDEDDEMDDEDDDGDINPRMEKAITIMGIAAAVVIVIIIIYLLVSLFGGVGFGGNSSTETESTQTESQSDEDSDVTDGVPVPSVVGKTYDEAMEELSNVSLGIKQVGTASSDTVEEGQIVSQNPEADETVEKNTTIEVIISSGKGSVDIPNVVGQSEADAVSALTAEGFVSNKTYSYSSTVASGYVISQSPEGDSQGKKGDTITIEISQGPETVTVPDVTTTYKSEEQARELLTDFNVSTNSQYSDTPAGIVIGQSLDAGTQAEKGASITITVSLGPEPADVVTPTTYRLNISLQLPSDTSNISGADIVLYDDEGNVLETWEGRTIEDFGTDGLVLTKSGILAERGKIVVTWLDLNGEDLNDQTFDVEFRKES